MTKPKVGDQTWIRIFHDDQAEVYESQENPAFFYKVVINRKAKYFYGETAHMDYQRYVIDNTKRSYVVNNTYRIV